MNPIVWIALLGAGSLFVLNAINASNTGAKSSIKLLNVDSLKVIGTEFEISSSIAIDNPTANNLSIKKPYIKMFFNEKEIGNSIPSGEYILVKGNARTIIKNVNLRIPFTSVPVLALAIFNAKSSEQTIGIEVSTVVSGIEVKDKREIKIADLIKLLKK